jgi:uncharacterized protein (TIGR02594 family)
MEPQYLTYAKSLIGTKEVRGPKHNPIILQWLVNLGAWWREDETPWCGIYVAECLRKFGYGIPKFYMRAKAYLDYGTEIKEPCLGCIVVFGRKGGGHVGFVVGYDLFGNLLVLGGNQGNEVNIKSFALSRVLGYRLPSGFWLDPQPLQVLNFSGELSTNEA